MNPCLKSALDLVFPRSCVHCGDAIEESPYEFLCTPCAQEILPCLPPACKTCGYPFFGAVVGPKVCPHCVDLDPVFDHGKALFIAKTAGRSLLHHLKYQSGFYVLRDLQKIVTTSRHYYDYIQDATFVPVPLHPTKLRERGFNQSERIAKMLVAATEGRSQVEHLLIRRVYTQSQTRLNHVERHRNVKNAFALAPDAVLIPDKQYILVDDVFTTGSTLNACARVLRDAGVLHLNVVTIGHG
ncbi:MULTISPECIES: ComF family protein [unclassified Lentimonas]|uniref:ComF family protein n=1 Tax=unclassified Lentimonas TaxID=2630993 RepID=UPI0013288389|nr:MULTISPECIES: ComF family protein [unclassified Lentimonas]CAA6690441.1 Competence protein F homolog, phosphoribosyltransferase domain; protein YhgH required for utilization of DNA as sole source of carbon and energy [Lentimonas sp. CC19]CAA6693835.1 Competence protein F homolog, phosphoribosyltransferase domain; protein YhgH required for utilization of DNA as sole source of carbon and energy [Lentimonas sp. CC10]CAA7068645.1 Competence protein F homolog, phosphoribosyltransferase domain; pro